MHLKLGAHGREEVGRHAGAQGHIDPGRKQARQEGVRFEHPGHPLGHVGRTLGWVGRALGCRHAGGRAARRAADDMDIAFGQNPDLVAVEEPAMGQHGAVGEEAGPVEGHDRLGPRLLVPGVAVGWGICDAGIGAGAELGGQAAARAKSARVAWAMPTGATNRRSGVRFVLASKARMLPAACSNVSPAGPESPVPPDGTLAGAPGRVTIPRARAQRIPDNS